jgi:hypothetical protein
MTIPDEERVALFRTRELLEWLLSEYNSRTTVTEVREKARSCYRHYPFSHRIETYFEDKNDQPPKS